MDLPDAKAATLPAVTGDRRDREDRKRQGAGSAWAMSDPLMRTVSRERFQVGTHLVCSYYSLTERINEIMFEMGHLCKETELRWGGMPPCAASDDWVVDQKNVWGGEVSAGACGGFRDRQLTLPRPPCSQVDTCEVGVIAWVSQTSTWNPRCTILRP